MSSAIFFGKPVTGIEYNGILGDTADRQPTDGIRSTNADAILCDARHFAH